MDQMQRLKYAVLCSLLGGSLGAIASASSPAQAQSRNEASEVEAPEVLRSIDRDAATTVEEWFAQEAELAQALPQVTGIRVNTAETGVELILETADGQPLSPSISVLGNALIADIPNAVLALPEGDEFEAVNPIEGIAFISVTSVGDRVRVAITGTDAPPAAEVRASTQGLALGITLGTGADAAADADAIQVLVTGAQDEGYNPDSAVTATRTDTPLRDVPGSVSVIPQQLLEDQNTTRLQDALQNVSGMNRQGNYGGTDGGGFVIRGFAQEGNFRNGLNDNDFYSSTDPANIERIEVLRGPASVLYGQVEPGGIINVVTEQPLSFPYYSAEFSAGQFSFYRPSLDFSDALTADGLLRYRLNVAYQNSESFRDFNFTDRVFIAPVFTWNISDRTSLTFDFEYLNNSYRFDRGLPSLGDEPAPVPISRFVGLPFDDDTYTDLVFRAGYRFQHQFSEDWELRNAFSYVSSRSSGSYAIAGRELEDNRFSPISVSRETFDRETLTLQTEVVGQFNTGSIAHRPLIGVELRRIERFYTSFDAEETVLLDIFNPDYDVALPDIPDEATFDFNERTNSLGLYLQDQISIADNIELLLGGRFDTTTHEYDDNFSTAIEQTDTAFSPRIGIVYQPIEPISLYASYSRSFSPVLFQRSATNDPFDPTIGTQYEIGVKAEISDRLSATLAAFQLTRTNVLTADPDNPDFSIQVGEQRNRGIELDLGGEILPGWNVITSYAYTDAITSEDNTIPVGNRIPNVPEHAASLWTTYRIQTGSLEGLGFGLGLYYAGDRFADEENTSTLGSYFRTDAAVYYERDDWKLSFNVRNLFDETYYEASQARNIIYPGAPFTLIGSFSIEF